MSTESNRRFALLGIDDDVTTCDCCGKSELKCTMALSEMDADGNEIGVVRYGRDCGARALGWKVSADRAEKLARGTATLRYDDLDRIWRAGHKAVHVAGQPPVFPAFDKPAKGEIDGVAIEVWDPWRGPTPGDGWTRVGTKRYARYDWRVAA